MDMSDEHESDLVMPFVTVTSVGGPHDDAAYVAGFEVGQLDAQLEANPWPKVGPVTVHRTNLAQLDLVAMRYGMAMVVDPDAIEQEADRLDPGLVAVMFLEVRDDG